MGPPPLTAWLIEAQQLSWPNTLRFGAFDGHAQPVVAQAIRNPDAVAELRAGVEQAVDLLAWNQAEQIRVMRQEQAPTRALVDQMRAELERISTDAAQQKRALRGLPFRRLIRLQRHLQLRFRGNPLAMDDTFSSDADLAADPDVAASGVDALDHYYVHGLLEGRSTR